MILTGKTLNADRAKKAGLVDLVVDPAALEQVAVSQARGLVAGTVKPSKRKRDWVSYFMEETPLRSVMFSKAKETVDKNTGGHYPAPYAIINVLKDNFGKSKSAHLQDEAAKFAQLAATPVSEALIGLFHGTTAVKKHSYGAPTHPVKKIAVLGAGLMGAGNE